MTINVNSGKPWAPVDLYDLRQGLGRGTRIDQVADFLCRDVSEVRAKALQLGLLRQAPRRSAPYARREPAYVGRRVPRRTGRGGA